MGKSLFVLTQKDLAKLSVIMLLAVIFFGLTGLIIMLFFQWITLRSYAADAADKHGISQVSASRLGGLAIFISWLGLMLAGYYNGYLGGRSGGPAGPYWIDWFAVVVASSSGITLVGYLNQWWLVTSHFWGWVFLFQWVGYGVIFYLTGLNRSNSQYVVVS